MTEPTVEVLKAAPYLAVQDRGRPGYRAQGVPQCGAMDPWAIAAANVLVGNAQGAAALEWALGGGAIRWAHAGAFALAGASVEATLDGVRVTMRTTYRAEPGSILAIDRFSAGRFVYVALEGGIDVPVVLGSRATYVPAKFGGLDGRLLRSGDAIRVLATTTSPPRVGFTVPPDLLPDALNQQCGVVPGPYVEEQFGSAGWERLVHEPFRIERSSDRMGYRLNGPGLGGEGLGTLPSAPMCVGAVQVPHGGQPIVLMPDGPTVGGYPVIAVVSAAGLPTLAQRQPGEEIRFMPLSVSDAQRQARRLASSVYTLEHLAKANR